MPWRRDRLPTRVFLGFPCGSAGKEFAHNAGDLGLIPGLGSSPGLGRSPGEVQSYPLQYSGLENSMYCIVHGVTKSWTRQSDFHTHTHCQHGLVCILSFASLIGEIFIVGFKVFLWSLGAGVSEVSLLKSNFHIKAHQCKMYSLMIFGECTQWCNYYHTDLEHFHYL